MTTMQRLSALDWQFLGIEDKSDTHMHVGSQLILAGPAPSLADLVDFVSARIGLAVRFRQRLVRHPLDGGKPVWADDPAFDLAQHIIAVDLAAPGDQEALDQLTGEVFSHRLDRDQPLWRMWLVTGLADGNWALIMKMHHCMVDGLGAIDLFAALLDLTDQPRAVEPDMFEPSALPSSRDLLAEQARRNWRTAKEVARNLGSMVANPGDAGPRIFDVAKGMVETAQLAYPIAPRTPLNVETGPRRGFIGRTHSLADYKAIRKALGGSVNDVVLTITADALGRYFRSLGFPTAGLELRGQVPSAIREGRTGSEQGNVFVVLAVMLPVADMPIQQRHQLISGRMAAVKESGVPTAVGAILDATNFLPPTLLAQTSRLLFSRQLFNLLISNVPGVQFPVFLNGRQLLRMSPLPWVGPQQALSVAVVSYLGQMEYGFMFDRDALTDPEGFARCFDAAFDDLRASVQE